LQKAKSGDPFAYLVKPFTESELRTTIEVALHKHRQEQQVRETADWFSQTVNGLGGAVIGTDGQGIVRHMNSLAETLTHSSEADAIGRSAQDVLTLKQIASGAIIRDLCLTSPASGQVSRSFDCILVTRNGREIPIEMTIIASGNSPKQDGALLFAFREISQRVTPLQDWFSWVTNLRLTGALCKRERRLGEAESFFRRALDILETHMGADHRKVAELLDELSDVCTAVGKDRDAHIMRLRAERIRVQSRPRAGLTGNMDRHIQQQTMIT
jgi:PAS domain-containing protein